MMWRLVLCTALVAFCYGKHTVIICGPSGAGKSSLINFMANTGTEVAKEGMTYASETLAPDVYDIPAFDTVLIDTPGLHDTAGYTDAEIADLIKSELLQQSQNSISGAILLFDATQTKIHLASMIEAVVHIFGEDILKHLLVAFNKNDRVDDAERQSIVEFCLEEWAPIAQQFNVDDVDFAQRILFIDTKGDFDRYSGAIHDAITSHLPQHSINLVEADLSLQKEIEKCYEQQLRDLGNYRTWTEEIPHSEKKQRTRTVDVQTPYKYQCNRRRVCSARILGICIDRDTVWDTCVGHKNVPTEITEEYIDTWYEKVEKKALKYSEQFLVSKCKELLRQQIKNKVFVAARNRMGKKDL